MKEVAAGGFVYRKQGDQIQFLLIDDQYGHISFPKGRNEEGETVQETALREIKEETGIEGVIQDHLQTIHYSYQDAQRGTIQKESIFFLVEALSDQITPQVEEIVGANWYTPSESIKLQAERGYPGQSVVFRHAFQTVFPLVTRIDHTLLRMEATISDYRNLVQEATMCGFASVCVPPSWVSMVKQELQGTGVKVGTVVGFPFGYTTWKVKEWETRQAVEQGAEEIDMVFNLGAFLSGEEQMVVKDIQAVTQAAAPRTVKVILETPQLQPEEITRACMLAEKAGAHFVKTATGFGQGGATVAAVQEMKKAVGNRLSIKASGGIRDQQTANQMIEAGAVRIGTSAGATMFDG